MPVSFQNRTVAQVAINQTAAGTDDLIAAVAGLKIYVVTVVVSLAAAGTIKFQEGTGPTDITGEIPLAAGGGFVVTGGADSVALQTNVAGNKLSIVTTGGAADGWLRYFTAA